MKIPKEELIKLGFVSFPEHDCYENRVNGYLLKDLNDDGSVDLKYLLMVYESMGALNALEPFSELIASKVKELVGQIDVNEILTVES